MTQESALKVMKMGKNVFLTGAAGTGKTYVLNEYIKYLKEHGIGVAITASTGIAATHIGGMTIHSWSGIGIKDHLSTRDIDSLEQRQYLWSRYKKADVLIIDEISMLKASVFDCIDKLCRGFKRNPEPFGGMQVIITGDFFQLPPISRDRNPIPEEDISQAKDDFEQTIDLFDNSETINTEQIISDRKVDSNLFCFRAAAWKDADLHTCYLSKQFRQNDDGYLEILNDIRKGNTSDKSIANLKKRVVSKHPDEIPKLFAHNSNVDEVNEAKLNTIGGESKVFMMRSFGAAGICEALKKGCLAPSNLSLKIGAQVMFVKNSAEQGYVNGTTGEVIDFKEGYPVVRAKDGKEYVAYPSTWSVEEGQKVLGSIEQVPLKLAWAVTIHKSQGMTLDNAYIDLSQAFVEGQGYVALSRIRNLAGLYLKGFNDMSLKVHQDVLIFDKHAKKQSEIIEKRLHITPEENIDKHAESFKTRNGKGKSEDKKSTFDETFDLVVAGKSMDFIIRERGLKEETIITHLARLRDDGKISTKEIKKLVKKIPKKDLTKIGKAFEKIGTDSLKDVRTELKNTFSYKDLHIAKLLLEI